jgi:prepilin-type N-terminal cleavage/methylation domain-containing protein
MRVRPYSARFRRRPRGFTIVELLVVMAMLSVLIGILLVTLSGVGQSGAMTRSMSSLQQIGQWMTLYSGEYRDTIVPSRFNYQYPDTPDAYRGHVRSFPDRASPWAGEEHRGTWTDILWTMYADTAFTEALGVAGHDYRSDSPDQQLYDLMSGDVKNPFRSAANNTRNTDESQPTNPSVLPLGFPDAPGAQSKGEPGFFAANNFFNADSESATFNGWWSHGQIRLPSKSLYAIDSWAGEIIEVNDESDLALPDCAPWTFTWTGFVAGGDGVGPSVVDHLSVEGQVDFRYQDATLILYLDNHVKPETRWTTMEELQGKRGIRVRTLDTNEAPDPCP